MIKGAGAGEGGGGQVQKRVTRRHLMRFSTLKPPARRGQSRVTPAVLPVLPRWLATQTGAPTWRTAGRFVPQSGDAPGVLMQEATFLRRATEDWIGLSALDYSFSWNLGREPQAGIKAGLWP